MFTRLVLKPEVTWAGVLTPCRQMRGWTGLDFTPLLPDVPYVKQWRATDGDCVIAYVQDPLREVRYFHLTGADREAHAAAVRARIATFDVATIRGLQAAARTPAQVANAVYHTAAAADPADLAFLTRCLSDPEPSVRYAAVDSTLLSPWPELADPLTRVAAADPDLGLRVFAAETLDSLRRRVWAAPPGTHADLPLPPDRTRVVPRTGVGDDWHEAAHGTRPTRSASVAAVPAPAPRGDRSAAERAGEVRTDEPVGGDRAAFVFDFRECHSPDGPAEGWADQAARLQFLRGFGWEPWGTARSTADLGEAAPEDYCEPEFRTAAEWEAAAREVLVGEVGVAEEEFEVAVEMLAELTAAGGWTFVGGGYVEFCGNHNDTWLVVVLQR